jgi:hypothetical protein
MEQNSQSASVMKNSRVLVWIGRVISVLPVLLLLWSGYAKITRQPQVIKGFAEFGFPDSVIVPIGVTEVVVTIIYVIPQTAVLGAILMTGYLGGATCTHVRAAQWNLFYFPIIAGVLVWLGLFFRDSRIRALTPFRKL